MKKHLPWLIPAVFAAWFLSTLIPAREDKFAFGQFGRLPLLYGGRHQPLDSFARNTLVQITERHELYDSAEKRSLSAAEWLAEVMFKPEAARGRRVFRVVSQQLKQVLKLPESNVDHGENGKLYSWNQIATEENFNALQEQTGRAIKKAESQRDAYDQAVLKLANGLELFNTLQRSARSQDATNFTAELAFFQKLLPANAAVLETIRARYAGKNPDAAKDDPLVREFSKYVDNHGDPIDKLPLILPPEGGHEWSTLPDRLLELTGGEPLPKAMAAWARIGDAFHTGNSIEFNAAVADYSRYCTDTVPADMTKSGREVFFNRLAPFYKAMIIYLAAFLCAVGFWFNFAEWLRVSAFRLVILAFVIHMSGLLFRMVLEGRPPVTNLYSSAIFIGWGAVVLGMVLERFWRNAIGLTVGSLLGFITLVIAHNLALDGDTMIMLRAVLDTNFWLATHVVIVTLGYASTFVAGFLAIVYVVRGFFTRSLDQNTARSLARMVYGIVCFATLFSFVGTVLGGIWADQSWGRFWGWDPKENGALIIVLWNALVLHARWGGLVRERGVMTLAIAGNIVTSWSWFGVNMLGIGLHSYGFMSGAFTVLATFVVSQLVLIGLGCLPPRYWQSFKNLPVTPTKPSAPSAPMKGGGKPRPAVA
ncbi:MAG TPA: cytochrome c biogenesis protein CcsA [Candidatus Limnocylindria bacterium]|nr:cytochrome c biogenesis protein CcsA [Candidatus Limnocylindria bacterium]